MAWLCEAGALDRNYEPKGVSAARSHEAAMARVQDLLLGLQLQQKIRTPLVALTLGPTKGPPVLQEPAPCHPRSSCSAHSLAAEEHPRLGISRTGAGSSTATEDSTGGRPRQDDAPHGFRASTFPPLSSLSHSDLDFGAAQLSCLLLSSICLPQPILSARPSYPRET